MFLSDAVHEQYCAAIFGVSLCATTALNGYGHWIFCWTRPEWIPAGRKNGQYQYGSDRRRSCYHGLSADVAVGVMAVDGMFLAGCDAVRSIAWHLYS